MDRGAWWAAVYGVAQSRTRLTRLSSSSSTLQCNDFYYLDKHQKPLIFLFTLLEWGRKLAVHIYFVQSLYLSSMVIRKELISLNGYKRWDLAQHPTTGLLHGPLRATSPDPLGFSHYLFLPSYVLRCASFSCLIPFWI